MSNDYTRITWGTEFEDASLLASHTLGQNYAGNKVTRVQMGQGPGHVPQQHPTDSYQPRSGAQWAAPSAAGAAESTRVVRSPNRHTVTFEGTKGGSVAETLQRMGAHRTVELIPGEPGSRTDVRAAVRAGLIEPDGKGGFRDAVQVQQAVQEVTQEVAPKAPEAPSQEAFNAADLEAWAEDIAPLSQEVYDANVSRVIEAVTLGDDINLGDLAHTLAASAGMDKALAADYITHGGAMYQRAADATLAKAGIVGEDLQEFYGWVRSTHQHNLRFAIQKLVFGQDASEFQKLGYWWLQSRQRR